MPKPKPSGGTLQSFAMQDTKESVQDAKEGDSARAARDMKVKETLVRTAIGIGVSPAPTSDYSKWLARLQAAKADVGNKFQHSSFAKPCISEASALLLAMSSDDVVGVQSIVPMTGIVSDLTLHADAVDLVKTKATPHGSFCLFAAGATWTNPRGETMTQMAGACSHGVSSLACPHRTFSFPQPELSHVPILLGQVALARLSRVR